MGIEHDDEILLSVTEVAKRLHLAKRTVAKMRKEGVLTPRSGPRRRTSYVTLESVLAYVEAEKVTLRELVIRVSALEKRMNKLAGGEDEEMVNLLRQFHPHLGSPNR